MSNHRVARDIFDCETTPTTLDMKIRINLFCLALAAFSSPLYATSNPYYYGSAAAGIFEANFDNRYLDQTSAIPQNISQPADQHSYIGQVAIGYRHPWIDNYFVGGELSASIEGHNASFQSGASSTAFSDNTQIQYHSDATFVPGIMLSESAFSYLKFGLSYAVIQDTLSSPTGYTPTTQSYHSRKHAIGFTAGIGASKAITDRVMLFTEGNYHDYGTIDFNNFQNFSSSYTHSSHIYSYNIIAGIAFQFSM